MAAPITPATPTAASWSCTSAIPRRLRLAISTITSNSVRRLSAGRERWCCTNETPPLSRQHGAGDRTLGPRAGPAGGRDDPVRQNDLCLLHAAESGLFGGALHLGATGH